MATKIVDGKRVVLTAQEEQQRADELANRVKNPQSRNRVDVLQDLLIAKGLMEESERV